MSSRERQAAAIHPDARTPPAPGSNARPRRRASERRALVSVREQLQAIKHADVGYPDEAVRVRELMYSVEAFVTLIVRVGWAKMGADQVTRLCQRFAA
ncbi:hypothetical protein [Nocardia sp. NPDC059239]|uniref:hypothetical protein n=1 Tax=Nocardia sp. NPDC059239 TaxID=3346785 RepID=UPI0036D16E82